MAQEIIVKQICPQCGGDGWFGATSGPDGQGPHPCHWRDCNQTGYITLGKFILDPGTDDLQDKHEDILEKLDDILEKLNGM